MPQTWLKTNARATAAGLVPASLLGLCGGVLLAGMLGDGRICYAVGWLLAVLSITALAVVTWQLRRPRLAFGGGKLWIYLRWTGPIGVPIEYVEGFLLGQGESFLPGKHAARMETRNLVIRLAERAEAWARVDVDRSLGSWCNHYVTIRGAWCEPLGVDVATRLNARLAEVLPRRRYEQALG
jgi:hypothetical protein